MTAKYSAGDKVRVNGQEMTLGSWPEDNVGPFFATYKNNAGGEVQVTLWAGQVETDGEPVYNSSNVDLVEKGDGVESTAGDLEDDLRDWDSLHQTEESVTADALRKAGLQDTTPGENAKAAAGLTSADDVHAVSLDGDAIPTPQQGDLNEADHYEGVADINGVDDSDQQSLPADETDLDVVQHQEGANSDGGVDDAVEAKK